MFDLICQLSTRLIQIHLGPDIALPAMSKLVPRPFSLAGSFCSPRVGYLQHGVHVDHYLYR